MKFQQATEKQRLFIKEYVIKDTRGEVDKARNENIP